MKEKVRNIGIEAKPPKEKCLDPKCPWHGSLSLRGKVLEGKVVSSRPSKTVIVERGYLHHVPKYERYEKRRSRIAAHNPDCISAREGDKVRISECRKLSKTKAFVVVEKLQHEKA
jgi:small subunit ribosomal protein S17